MNSQLKTHFNLSQQFFHHEQLKILKDYYHFFTDPKGTDMLPYAYMESSSTYDLMVKNNPNYYLFTDEVFIIKKFSEKLAYYLADIEEIVEIGPGSAHTIANKTIPLLNYASSLKNYYAIDHSKSYLDKACSFLKENTNNINIIGAEANLMSLGNLKAIKSSSFKKCMIFLGGTIGNFSSNLQLEALSQIFQLMNQHDKLILAIDTNQDEKSLMAAYDNIFLHELVKGILKYFTKINDNFQEYIDFFKVCSAWNRNLSLVDIYFQATHDMAFEMDNYRTIFINKDQELRGIISSKISSSKFNDLLYKTKFHILDTLSFNNKLQLIICQKP